MNMSTQPSAHVRPSADIDDGSTDVTDQLVLPQRSLKSIIEERPVVAVGAALLAGFIAGRIASRLFA